MNSRTIHLHNLGVEFNVDVILDPKKHFLSNYPLSAFALEDKICVNGYTGDQISYYAALHEFGHIVLGHCVSRLQWYYKNVLEGEAEAWQWAIDNSQEEIEYATKRFIIGPIALGSYSSDPQFVGSDGLTYHLVIGMCHQ